mgnify:CR=1 FL=1
MATKVRYGYAAKLYFGNGSATPTLTEIANVREVKVGITPEEIDAWVRASGFLKTTEPGGAVVEVTGKIRADENDTSGFLAMRTAVLTAGGGSGLDVVALNGSNTETGVVGIRFTGKVTMFPSDQDNAGIQYHEFALKPCISELKFQKVSVVNSVATYTDLN